MTDNVNVYNLYGTCYHNDDSEAKLKDKYGQVKVGDELKTYKKYATALDYTPWLKKNPLFSKKLKELPPCTFGEPIIEYLNKEEIRNSLHIPQHASVWDLCRSEEDGFYYTEDRKGSEWIY